MVDNPPIDINDPYPHDTMFKRSMEIKEVAQDFLEQILPSWILEHIDLATLKLEKNDFIDNTIGKGFVDVIFSVKMQGKTAYILIESQSNPDYFMPARIDEYKSLIYKSYRKKNPNSKHLPSIIPIVFYNCRKPAKMPRKISELTAYPDFEEILEIHGTFEYQLPDISDEKIIKKKNSSIMLLIMKHAKAKNILSIIKNISSNLTNMAKKNFLYFQDCLIYTLKVGKHKKPKLIIYFFRDLTISKKQKEAVMNMAQQLVQEGKMETQAEIAKNMLAAGYDLETMKRITGLSIRKIKELLD